MCQECGVGWQMFETCLFHQLLCGSNLHLLSPVGDTAETAETATGTGQANNITGFVIFSPPV